MEKEQRSGVLTCWFERGYGFVVDEKRNQFFLHTNSILEGPPIPERGSTVVFEVAPPNGNGRYKQAVNAIVTPAKAVRA
jgi:hypothetical protein